MSKPWFKCHPRDFLEGTEALTNEEFGVYSRILLLIYRDGGPIKYDAAVLRHTLKCYKLSACRKLIKRLVDLGKLFIDSDGLIHNGRADRELAPKGAGAPDNRETIAGQSGDNPKIIPKLSTKKRNKNYARSKSQTQSQIQKERESATADSLTTTSAVVAEPAGQHQLAFADREFRQEEPDPEADDDIPPKLRGDMGKAIAAWQKLAGITGLSRVVEPISDVRRKRLAALLKRYGLRKWMLAMDEIEASDFCRGGGNRGWTAEFDWLLNPQKFSLVLEGKYRKGSPETNGNGHNGNGRRPTMAEEEFADLRARRQKKEEGKDDIDYTGIATRLLSAGNG